MFESPTSLWVADASGYAISNPSVRFNVVHYALWAGTWLQERVVWLEQSPIRSITGRTEGPTFALYAVSATTLYRYSSVDSTTLVLATAPVTSYFRGVAPAPYLASLHSAAPLPSWTPTPSITPSISPSASYTASVSTTPSGSLSSGATPSKTPSATSTASTTGTPSTTATQTKTSSPTATPTCEKREGGRF